MRDLLAGTEEWRSVASIIDVHSPKWRLAGHEKMAEQAITAVLKSQYIEEAPMELSGENLFYSTAKEEYRRWLCDMRLDLPPDVWMPKSNGSTTAACSGGAEAKAIIAEPLGAEKATCAVSVAGAERCAQNHSEVVYSINPTFPIVGNYHS